MTVILMVSEVVIRMMMMMMDPHYYCIAVVDGIGIVSLVSNEPTVPGVSRTPPRWVAVSPFLLI